MIRGVVASQTVHYHQLGLYVTLGRTYFLSFIFFPKVMLKLQFLSQIYTFYKGQSCSLNLNCLLDLTFLAQSLNLQDKQAHKMLEYLIMNDHIQAAKAFKQVSNLTWKQQLVSSFTKGHRESFFKIFQLLRRQQKLEFYLRVYFLIYPIHPNLNQNNKAALITQAQISSFRLFLDTKGVDLAKTSQFLQFYALPFIKKPLQHATFKTLFTKQWVSNLKQKLTAYINIQQQSMKQSIKCFTRSTLNLNPQPIPINKNKSRPQPYEQKFKQLQQSNNELLSQLQLTKQKYKHLDDNHQAMIQSFNEYMMESQNKWFESYKQLVKTAKGLLEIVANTKIQNQKYERRYMQARRKIEKYDRFVAKKLQDLLSVSQDISVFDKPSINQISQYTMKSALTSKSWLQNALDKPSISNNNNNITSYVQIDEYIATNFSKLNNQFLKLFQPDQNMLIRGFCWRLIKAKCKQIRRFYCIGLIKNNFLGLGKIYGKSQEGQLQLCTKYLSDKRFNEATLQLLNYMKVDYFSRQYLFAECNITSSLMQVMAQSLQSNSLQALSLCMDILSTISAYKDYRQGILQTQLPIFLLKILQQYPKIFESQQLMQLMMMILMNFSSFQGGLQMLEEYQNIFSTLSLAFEHEHHNIMMLVNGFYYTLLSNKRLYEIALQSNMPEFVKYLLNEPEYKQHQRQLKFIQQRLNEFQGDKDMEELKNSKIQNKTQFQDEEEEEELFLIDGEEEFEQFDEIIEDELQDLEEYVKGHEILSNKYGLREKEAEQQDRYVKSADEQFVRRTNQNKQQVQKKDDSKSDLRQKQNNGDTSKSAIAKSIPQQSRLRKPAQIKSQQIQVSLINLGVNSTNPQSNNKKQTYNSPISKVGVVLQTGQAIPRNSKQAQFMGLSSNQKDCSSNRQNNQLNSQKKQFIYNVPTSQLHQNLPNFGYNNNVNPTPELGPEQKNRRKKILKQINEEIQIKENLKTEKKTERNKTNKSNRSASQKNVISGQNVNFNQKRLLNENQQQGWKKGVRSNVHMKFQWVADDKTKIHQQKERKAFESRPKIVRTPPKQQPQ